MRFDSVPINTNFTDVFDTQWQKISKTQAKCLSKNDVEYAPGAVEYFSVAEDVCPNPEKVTP